MAAEKKEFGVAIAVDDSPYSEAAVKYYFKHLHQPENKVYLVHTTERMSPHEFVALVGMAAPRSHGAVNADMLQKLIKRQQEELNQLRKKIEMHIPKHVSFSWKLIDDDRDAGVAVVDVAEETKCGAIVVGSRGLGAIKRALLGSVSDFIVHHASVPVIVIRQEDLE